jgi:hypothetical protein
MEAASIAVEHHLSQRGKEGQNVIDGCEREEVFIWNAIKTKVSQVTEANTRARNRDF